MNEAQPKRPGRITRIGRIFREKAQFSNLKDTFFYIKEKNSRVDKNSGKKCSQIKKSVVFGSSLKAWLWSIWYVNISISSAN